MQKILIVTGLLLLSGVQGCVDDAKPKKEDTLEIDREFKLTQSNSAGQLIASAVKEYYNVDVALIPSVILKDGPRLRLGEGDEAMRSQILGLYDETKDTIRTGSMRGKDIKDFLLRRLTRYMDVDLQVAGVHYDLHLRGGWPESFVVTRERGLELEDDRVYRVALSNYFYDYRSLFPGYYYGDGMSFSFNVETDGYGSIQTALESFLDKRPHVEPLNEPRGYVHNRLVGEMGHVSIPEIQGIAHLSPYRGYRLTTRGVITGIAVPKESDARPWRNFPGRELPTEIIIQDPRGDGDDRSSDAISVYLPDSVTTYKVGQLIEVRGVVHEMLTDGGLSGTSLRLIDSIEVLAENQPLPEPISIGAGHRMIRSYIPSTFPGNVNAREELNLDEGIDFWESLEGMRATLLTPRVTGVRGGLKDFNAAKQGRANYVEISLVAAGMDRPEDRTSSMGNFYDPYTQDFNVESLKMIDTPFAPAINPSTLVLENGDQFASSLEGIIGFHRNTFGVGRYVFYYTGKTLELPRKGPTEMEDRPKTRFDQTDDHLTFATWNVENLGASDTERIKETAKVISTHLKCPDIMTLPEIQDNNAERITGGSAADQTLANIIKNLNCPQKNGERDLKYDYRALNIDPVPFRDGGEYGGNIRVAILYNAARVSFTPRGNPTATSETYVQPDGSLSQNPGRIEPLNPVLEGARKSLAAEFHFRGQRVFVIGNHFNSMLDEGSPLGAIHPYRFKTEPKRTEIADIIRRFVETLRSRDPKARVIVAGDFNAYHQSGSMKTLAGDFLVNMMTFPGMFPQDKWYTTNYDGNSGAIDFIFASQALMEQRPEFEILHINSPYMVKTSDHDPVMARFKF